MTAEKCLHSADAELCVCTAWIQPGALFPAQLSKAERVVCCYKAPVDCIACVSAEHKPMHQSTGYRAARHGLPAVEQRA